MFRNTLVLLCMGGLVMGGTGYNDEALKQLDKEVTSKNESVNKQRVRGAGINLKDWSKGIGQANKDADGMMRDYGDDWDYPQVAQAKPVRKNTVWPDFEDEPEFQRTFKKAQRETQRTMKDLENDPEFKRAFQKAQREAERTMKDLENDPEFKRAVEQAQREGEKAAEKAMKELENDPEFQKALKDLENMDF